MCVIYVLVVCCTLTLCWLGPFGGRKGIQPAKHLLHKSQKVDWERCSLTSSNSGKVTRHVKQKLNVVAILYVYVCVPVQLAKEIAHALNSKFPPDLTIVHPGTAYYLNHHDILCIRCKVKFHII